MRSALDPLCNFREVAVLCYHEYDPHLAEHLAALRARGCTFVPLSGVVAWAKGAEDLPRKAVAVTFDDGYPDFERQVLPVLARFGAPSALFAVGTFPVETLRGNARVEVGYHTKTHPNLTKFTEAEIVAEVTPPRGERFFAYPGGNHSRQAALAVRAAGYEAAFTIRPVTVRRGMDPYLLPRAVVTPAMSTREVMFYTSRAADWYRVIKNML